MRSLSVAVIAGISLLMACAKEELALPADPIDRAATCGVVAAAEARTATDITQVLPFEAQGRIVHYALLAASEGGTFSGEAATRVSSQMAVLEGGITSGKWQSLVPQCASAFPAAENASPKLPEARFEAQLGCNELADFMLTALAAQESDYGNELAEYRDLKRDLETPLVPGIRARAGNALEAQLAERHKALGGFAKLGSPIAVLKQCVARFG